MTYNSSLMSVRVLMISLCSCASFATKNAEGVLWTAVKYKIEETKPNLTTGTFCRRFP